jgi:hypothetical protein
VRYFHERRGETEKHLLLFACINVGMNEREEGLVTGFLSPYFPENIASQTIDDEAENAVIDSVLAYIDERFTKMKYILGLAMDFTLLAQRLANVDAEAKAFRPDLTSEQLLSRYNRITERGDTLANTLTLRYGDSEFGIRQIEEAVARSTA